MRRVVAILLAAAAIAGAAILVTHRKSSSSRSHAKHQAAAPAFDAAATRGATVEADPLATPVRPVGTIGAGSDETAAFTAAMDQALQGSHRRPGGPDGNPQAVVYVPPGVHRILRLPFRDNVRLEVDAGAVLEQAGGRTAPGGRDKYLIVWDGPTAGEPLRNVSLIGVGSHVGGVKQQAEPVEPGWDIADSFTMNLDPSATNASERVAGVELLNVDGFRIENLLSIQNADLRTPAWPTSAKAVLVLRPTRDSPKNGPYIQPRHGAIVHHYNIGSPRGFGPNQVGGADSVRFSGVYSRGGTALRLETDATKNKPFGGEIRGLEADTIVGVDCNRAVAFAPHAQNNYDVHIRGVLARGCSQGVIESADEKLGRARRGSFFDSTIAGVTVVAGTDAQDPANPNGGSKGAWVIGKSQAAFARDKNLSWTVTYTNVHCSGAFASPPDAIKIDTAERVPTCN